MRGGCEMHHHRRRFRRPYPPSVQTRTDAHLRCGYLGVDDGGIAFHPPVSGPISTPLAPAVPSRRGIFLQMRGVDLPQNLETFLEQTAPPTRNNVLGRISYS